MEEIQTIQLATRKRRFIAFFVDMLIISIIGYLSCFLFDSFYMRLGNYGKIIGATLVLIYFGIFDSKIGNGQTIGKKLFKIKVVNRKSECISILQSIERTSWIFLLVLLNGLSFSNSKYIPLVIIFGTIFFSIGILEIYFFICNKKTLQSFHDLFSDTFVILKKSEGEIEYKNNKKAVYCSVFIPICILIIAICINVFAKKSSFGEMINIIDDVQKDLPLHQTTIQRSITTTKSKSNTTQVSYVLVNTFKNNKKDNDKDIAIQIAKKVFDSDFVFKEDEIFSVVVNSGYDIGIASQNNSQRFNGTINQWMFEIEKLE